jgi:hypothetical protein
MRHVRSLVAFVYDFVVGDDWRSAVGVAVALGLAALLAHTGVSAWWLMPVAVVAVLVLSVSRQARPPPG